MFASWLRMMKVHFACFCKLLNLPFEPFEQYIWDLATYTPFVQGSGTFSEIHLISNLFSKYCHGSEKAVDPCSQLKAGCYPLSPCYAPGKNLSMESATLLGFYTNHKHWSGIIRIGEGKSLFGIISVSSVRPKPHDFVGRSMYLHCFWIAGLISLLSYSEVIVLLLTSTMLSHHFFRCSDV